MLIIIHKYQKRILNNYYSNYLFLFLFFWIIYFLKVLYTETIISNGLGRDWYEYILYSIIYVVIPFVAFFSIDYEKVKNIVLSGFIASGFALGLISTILYGKFLLQGVGRLNMITYQTGQEVLSPLALSYSGALTLVLCLYNLIIIKPNSKIYKIYLLITILLSFVMFLLGSSRGSVIALALTLPFFIWLSPLRKKIKLIFSGFILVPIIFLAIEFSGSSIVERISNTKEDRGGGRNVLWENAINHFMENPLIGGKIEIGGIYPHNIIIEILMATGVLGLFFMIPVIFKGFKLGFDLTFSNKSNLFVLLIMIQGFVQHFFTAGFYTSILLFVPIAMAFSAKNINSI